MQPHDRNPNIMSTFLKRYHGKEKFDEKLVEEKEQKLFEYFQVPKFINNNIEGKNEVDEHVLGR